MALKLNKILSGNFSKAIDDYSINDIKEFDMHSDASLYQNKLTAKPIDVLMHQANDSQNNMFEVFLLVRENKTILNEMSWGSLYSSRYSGNKFVKMLRDSTSYNLALYEMDASAFAFRCKTITFPQKQMGIDTKVLFGNVITRMDGSVKTKRSGSLTFSLDNNMYIMDGLNLLSNYYGSLHVDEKKDFIKDYKSLTKVDMKENYVNDYIFPCLFRKKYDLNDNKTYYCVDLVVKYLTDYLNVKDVEEGKYSLDEYSSGEIEYFVLHDVRFLGRSSALEFKHEDGGEMQVTYNFIYKDATTFSR